MTNTIQFGVGRADITPKPGMKASLAGYFNLRFWDKVLNDLQVRALALKKDGSEFLIVHCDLIGINDIVYSAVLKEIADLKQFSKKNVMICATHTHTAPNTFTADKNCGACPEYNAYVAKQAAAAIREAVSKYQEGTLCSTLTSDSRFCFNRRYWMKDGSVITNPGKLNPKIDMPEGPVDPEIPVLGIKAGGKLEVVVASISNHSDTTGGTGVSADWPGFTRRLVQKSMDGKNPMMIPLVGAAGNINHFDVSDKFDQTNPGEAERIGSGYADTIVKALAKLQPLPDFEMKTVFRNAECEGAEIPPKDLKEAKAILKKYKDIPDPLNSGVAITSEDLANGAPIALKYFAQSLVSMAEKPMHFKFNITGVSFGKVIIASLPGECFVEVGLDIRKRYFPNRLVLISELANGYGNMANGGGYIPNPWNYNRGGYETTPRSNPYEREASTKIRRAWMDVSLKKEL